jgi:transposase
MSMQPQAAWPIPEETARVVEGLTDRQAADAVRSRIDWKYALGLALTDPGLDYSVLSEFRGRLRTADAQERVLTPLLAACKARGLLRAGGKQRTDSTHVLAAIRQLNRLELVGETVAAALHDLLQHAPAWRGCWPGGPGDHARRPARCASPPCARSARSLPC